MNHLMRPARAIAVGVLTIAALAQVASARADEDYNACIAASDGSNQSWLQCGNAFVDREKQKFEAAWKLLIERQEGRTRDDLLAEHMAWLRFRDVACEFYNNGDLGREGQVLSYPVCKAQVYAGRSRVMESYDEGP